MKKESKKNTITLAQETIEREARAVASLKEQCAQSLEEVANHLSQLRISE